MECQTCGAYIYSDEICRACGSGQPGSRLPVKSTASVPVPWQSATRPLVRGVALVAAGLLAEWALRSAARYVADIPSGRKSSPPAKIRPGMSKSELPPKGTVAISETVIMRRTIIRR